MAIMTMCIEWLAENNDTCVGPLFASRYLLYNRFVGDLQLNRMSAPPHPITPHYPIPLIKAKQFQGEIAGRIIHCHRWLHMMFGLVTIDYWQMILLYSNADVLAKEVSCGETNTDSEMLACEVHVNVAWGKCNH